jgi:hypothetical protein
VVPDAEKPSLSQRSVKLIGKAAVARPSRSREPPRTAIADAADKGSAIREGALADASAQLARLIEKLVHRRDQHPFEDGAVFGSAERSFCAARGLVPLDKTSTPVSAAGDGI